MERHSSFTDRTLVREGIQIWAARRNAETPNALGCQHIVERRTELGIPVVQHGNMRATLDLLDQRRFGNGMVNLRYRVGS